MTIFEGMCIGFLAGVVITIMCVCIGALIDDSDNSSYHNISIGDRDRSSDNRLDKGDKG